MPALKEFRKQKGLSMQYICASSNIAKTTLMSYEQGESFPRLDRAIKIAKALGISLNKLVELMGLEEGNNADISGN